MVTEFEFYTAFILALTVLLPISAILFYGSYSFYRRTLNKHKQFLINLNVSRGNSKIRRI